MMANISWMECRREFFLLLLVSSGLSILPPASCQYCNTNKFGEPLIKISSTPSFNKLPIGATINLTCTAWQNDELAMNYPKTRPHRIEWFDPQDKQVGECQAGSPAAALMRCTLMVGVPTEGKFGNYTCKASNGYNYCSTKRFPISLQDIQRPGIVYNPANQSSSIGPTVTFNCTVISQPKPTITRTETDSYFKQSNPSTTAMTADDKSLSSALSSYWFIVLFLPVVIGQM